MSSISWLDTSATDERRMREIVRLFSDVSTLDDLGIGQVRDGLGDLMFPGTSTLHTRPRYFAIIPWIFQRAAKKSTGTELVSKARLEERKLIEVFRTPPAVDGMIGKVAGKTVRVLPSQIYWSALQRYGILCDPKSYTWDVPVSPPADFPASLESGLDMTEDEAQWFRERILVTCPGSYLAHLFADGLDDDPTEAALPWTHPALVQASDDIKSVVEHARLFSLTINGAALVYNLIVAERYDQLAAGDESYVESYRDALAEWAEELELNREALSGWDLNDFWATVLRGRERNPVGPATKLFVDDWIARVRAQDAHDVASSSEIRTMITERERKNKGESSRLNNDRLIKNWRGASGAGRLNYRWGNVQRTLVDVREGLASASA